MTDKVTIDVHGVFLFALGIGLLGNIVFAGDFWSQSPDSQHQVQLDSQLQADFDKVISLQLATVQHPSGQLLQVLGAKVTVSEVSDSSHCFAIVRPSAQEIKCEDLLSWEVKEE